MQKNSPGVSTAFPYIEFWGRRFTILSFSFLVFLWFCLSTTAVYSGDLTILTEEFPPYNFTDKGRLTGVTTEVVLEILHRLNSDASIEVLPWARCYKKLLSEPNVVLFTTARTAEREELVHWVGPIYVFRLGFYAKKGNTLNIDSLEAAKAVRAIATYKDDFREQILKSLGFTNLDSSNSPQSNVRKLASERVDLWFSDNIGTPKVAHEAGIDPVEIEEIYTYQQNYSYIAISRQTDPSIVRQWQETLDEMKEDGTFWWLTSKWLPADAITVNDRQTIGKAYSLKLYTEDSPPSSYLDDGQLRGLSVEIVEEILHRIGKSETISLVPWARGYKLALSDAEIVLFSTTRLSQRETLFSWVGPLYQQRWGFYRWKDSGVMITDLEAAKKVQRIGTYRQDAKMQYLQTLGFDNLVPTNKNISNIAHLKKGDIDLWVSSDFNIKHLASQAGVMPEQLELASTFHTVGNYIAFSKSTSPHVIRLWQAVLAEMKADGTYKSICQRYSYEP